MHYIRTSKAMLPLLNTLRTLNWKRIKESLTAMSVFLTEPA